MFLFNLHAPALARTVKQGSHWAVVTLPKWIRLRRMSGSTVVFDSLMFGSRVFQGRVPATPKAKSNNNHERNARLYTLYRERKRFADSCRERPVHRTLFQSQWLQGSCHVETLPAHPLQHRKCAKYPFTLYTDASLFSPVAGRITRCCSSVVVKPKMYRNT